MPRGRRSEAVRAAETGVSGGGNRRVQPHAHRGAVSARVASAARGRWLSTGKAPWQAPAQAPGRAAARSGAGARARCDSRRRWPQRAEDIGAAGVGATRRLKTGARPRGGRLRRARRGVGAPRAPRSFLGVCLRRHLIAGTRRRRPTAAPPSRSGAGIEAQVHRARGPERAAPPEACARSGRHVAPVPNAASAAAMAALSSSAADGR